MVSHISPDSGETLTSRRTSPEADGDSDSGIEDELRPDGGDSTIFLAFKGDIHDEDFRQKLDNILENVPNIISMESKQLKVQKVEPWNSVRVTFNIPREAAERLRLLAQGNNQQLRDLGILSVQIEGEGAINLALTQNRGHEVRMNGPVGANNTMRLDAGFQMQGGAGLIRMNNPAVPMMSQGPHVSSSMMAAGASSDLQARTPRPPSQQDTVDSMGPGLTAQQQSHPSSSMTPQLHPMQTVTANRPMANFQQFQQQSRLPQHQQISQGMRPSFAAPSQVPVPPGWNQLASGALQPPPAQGGMGTVASNQGWKKSPMSGPMQQQQFPQRPSLATVQTPSHPPPPYPFGSQQASQAHTNFPSMSNPNQFSVSPMKPMQGGPTRVSTPLQQPHLPNKSPASSPSSSSFQQGSPASSPTVNQVQQVMVSRAAQGNSMPQGYQQQPVRSPSRSGMMQQGNAAGNFMMQQAQQQNHGPQGMHAGVSKRLPPGFQAGQSNTGFLQSQTPPSATGSPANGGPQQQGNGNGQGTGAQANGSSHGQMQGVHGGPNMMQANLMGLHSNLSNQQAGGSGVNQVNMVGLHGQSQQVQQSQLMGMHQQIISSQGQMVNLQGQAPLNTQGQLVLSRTTLMSQGQMLGATQNQNLGQATQRITPPKQMLTSHNQMMVSQGQAMLQQNPVMEQIMHGGKQGFNTRDPAGNMAGPSQINRGPNLAGNMVQYSGQTIPQQGTINNPSQVVNMQGQVLRPTGPSQHLQQQHGDTNTQGGGDLSSMLPELSMQQTGNMAAQHLQNMPGNSGPGQHFAGHGLPFSSPFAQGGNGSQMSCGQNSAFPVNKDVTLTSPLLVNLLQSDISAGHFGVNNKQNNSNAIKPKKKKPPRKKKVPPGEDQMSCPEPRMEETDQTGISGEQGGLDAAQKLSEFNTRPPGYPSEQRPLQQIPSQLMQLSQQQGQSGQSQGPQQQMMMMLMMQQQQQQQQDHKAVRLPGQQNVFNPRAALNADAQRMPMQQGGNMAVMMNLQGSSSIPPSPDKQRMPMAASGVLGNNGRKMGFQESGQSQSGSPLGDVSSLASLPDALEIPTTSGSQGNMASHLLMSQNQLMMPGTKPGAPSSLSLTQGTSPQQQHTSNMPGSHSHHFQSVSGQSQTSRPKTPNRASPRPYYPQTPNNRPPSTEPSEISLSPERLNASIAGLFPPQINIPLPPRPTLNRGFDQQGLNPTTLKAIGQAPPGLTVSNSSGFVSSHMNKMDNGAGKQPNAGGNKRASPSNSRRSSPASSRKTTPSPGRQNSKAPKFVLGTQQTPGLLHNIEMARNTLIGPASMQSTTSGPPSGHYPPMSVPVTSGSVDETKESPATTPDSENRTPQIIAKVQPVVHQEMKMTSCEEKDNQPVEASKPSFPEETKNSISPAMRDAPTSLSQLLDHSSAPNVTIKPSGPINECSPMQPPLEETKKAATPHMEPPSKEAISTPNPASNTEQFGTQAPTDMVDPNTSVPLNLPASTLKRSVGPTSMSTSVPPSQITVFVTSNPITTSANVSAPITSHLQPTLVSTVVTMPNVGNKVIVTEGQQAVQSNPRPQFITPVFINSSSIIQVMKGSQQGNLPASTMTPQSVAVVGPLHISPNIQFSSGPPSSAAPSSTVSSLPSTRPIIVNSVQATNQLTPSSSPSPHPPLTAPPRSCAEDTTSHPGTVPNQCSLTSSQPVASPSFDSNTSTTNQRSTAVASNKVEKIGQLLSKASKMDTNSPDRTREEQLSTDGENSDTTGTKGVETNCSGRTQSPLIQTTSETSNTTTAPSNPVCPTISATVDVPSTANLTPPTVPVGSTSQGGTVSEQTGTSLDKGLKEHLPETVAEPDPPENTEISEPAERSRPPSRRNSKVEESSAPLEVVESGQRKRSARPSSASSSTKEPGASPPQNKRRKSK